VVDLRQCRAAYCIGPGFLVYYDVCCLGVPSGRQQHPARGEGSVMATGVRQGGALMLRATSGRAFHSRQRIEADRSTP
jgi:hypothetical protein